MSPAKHKQGGGGAADASEEGQHLLAGDYEDEGAVEAEVEAEEDDDVDDDLVVHVAKGDEASNEDGAGDRGTLARTPSRVRFDLGQDEVAPAGRVPPASRGVTVEHERFEAMDEGDDYYDEDDYDSEHLGAAPRRHSHRTPLLTDLEAPGVTVARSLSGGDPDGLEADAERELQRPKSGMRSAFMNMANSIIGAGIIGQPYALRQAGLLAGVLLLLGLTAVVDWTICLIVINSKLSGTSSFQGTVEYCFGKAGLIAISLAQWAFAFGGMVAFCVIVGDTIPHVLLAVWPGMGNVSVLGLLTHRRVAILVFVLGVSYPLTLYRDIAKLAKASMFALIGMLIILIGVIIEGILTRSGDRGSFTTPLLTINGGVFQAIGVISFAFVCHHNSLLIYGSLKKPTIDNFSRVTHYSVGVSTLACLVMALAGFLTFGDRTLGNVLNNFSPDNTLVNIARLCFGLNMLTTLPLEAFVCREVMLTYWYPDEPFNVRRHLVFSTGLVVGALAISLVTCDLGAVFELVGATSAVAMAYILPPMCYIKLTSRSWRTYGAYAVVAFGGAVMVISVIQAVSKMISGGGEHVQCT